MISEERRKVCTAARPTLSLLRERPYKVLVSSEDGSSTPDGAVEYVSKGRDDTGLLQLLHLGALTTRCIRRYHLIFLYGHTFHANILQRLIKLWGWPIHLNNVWIACMVSQHLTPEYQAHIWIAFNFYINLHRWKHSNFYDVNWNNAYGNWTIHHSLTFNMSDGALERVDYFVVYITPLEYVRRAICNVTSIQPRESYRIIADKITRDLCKFYKISCFYGNCNFRYS